MRVFPTDSRGWHFGTLLPSATGLAISLVLAASLLFTLSCQLETADFSAYSNKNLIPEASLDNAGWVTDQDITTSPGNLYMGFSRIDNVAAGSFAAQTGFADAAALYSSLPDTAKTSAGGNPPVYRLEIKNLFRDGDFEASTVGALSWDGSGLSTDPAPILSSAGIAGMTRIAGADKPSTKGTSQVRSIINQADSNNFKASVSTETNGNALYLNTLAYDNTVLDLSDTNRTMYLWPDNATFNLSLRYRSTMTDILMALDDGTSLSAETYIKRNVTGAAIQTFPTSTETSNSTFNNSYGKKYLVFNPRINAYTSQRAITETVDDIKIIQVDKYYALRYEVPLAGNGRPKLAQGGTYTLKLYIRQDPTSIPDASGVKLRPNSFPSGSISLAVIDDTGNHATYWPSTTVECPNDSIWHEVKATFTGLLTNSTKYMGAADTTTLLQISITAMDTNGGFNRRFPGGLLIASPQLYWAP